MKAFSITFCIVVVLTFIGLIIGGCVVSWKYETTIGAYMENAQDMNTPDGMLEQLVLCTNAMRKNGLTDNLNSKWIFKTPSTSMRFQYNHIRAIIERAKAVEQWKNQTYKTTGTSQTENMGDVYNQKMENLRHYITNQTRSDWIARGAWYVNLNFFWYMPVHILWISLLILVIVFLVIAFKDEY
jgi:hypothetical protein